MSSYRVTSLAVSLLALGCNTAQEDEDITKTYNVIAVLPLTGPFAGKGPEHLKAIEMAFDRVEKAGGLDRPVRVFVIDAPDNDAALAEERLAAQIDQLTIGSRRYIAAILSSTTGAMKGAAPTALIEGIPFFEVSSGSGLDEVTLTADADRTYSFALRPLCMPEPEVTAELIGSRPTWGNVVVLRGSQAHDKMHTREFRDGMTMRGQANRIVNATDVEMSNTGPFDEYIDAAKATGAQVIYFHLNGDSANLAFLQAAERRGFTGKLVTCGMARRKELLHPTDPGIAPYLSENNSSEGRLFFAMRGPVKSASYDAFVQDFRAFSGYEADTFSPAAFDASILIALGLAAAQSSDGVALRDAIAASAAGGTKLDYTQIAQALAAARRGEDVDYDGASGSLDLSFDNVLGNVATGRYYFETVTKSSEYQYLALPSPVVVR